jgi:hypothetical protein
VRQRKTRVFKGKMRMVTSIVLKQISMAIRINNKDDIRPRLDRLLLGRGPHKLPFWARL